jgi:putative peptide zinc metalloprotease protein
MQNESQQDDQSTPQPVRIAIDPQIVFSRRQIGGRPMFIAHHPVIGKFFQLGAEEYRAASYLDGERSLHDILQLLNIDGIDWSARELAEFISKLITAKMANDIASTPAFPGSTEQPQQPSQLNQWFRRLLQLLSLTISQRIPLVDGHQIASRLEKRIGPVFSPIGMLCWSVLVGSGLMIVVAGHQEFSEELRRMFDPGIWLVLLVMWVVAKVFHEAGHATAARYHGVRVGKIGIMFFFLAPLAYVDVTNAWKLRSRWSRVQIALAGVYLELGTAAFAAWAWWILPEGIARHLAAQFVLVAGPATLLVNANPLLRLDGYYVVSDLTNIPNLRMHGRRQLAGLLEQFLLKTPPIQPLLSGWRSTFAASHAACSILFQIGWMSGLIIGVSIWAKGIGIVMAVAALVLWVIVPASRWCKKVWLYEPAGRWYMNGTRKLLLFHASLVLMILQYLCTSSSPLARRVPVVVQFRNEQIARAAADAFVRDVYVTRGERVEKGALLVALEEPELLIERDHKADELKIAEVREIQFRRQGELSQSAAESENAASMRRQLAELDEQIQGLTVIAKRSGLVIGPEIDNLQGQFVRQGTELLRISDPQEKELLAAVRESDIQAYQNVVSRGAPTVVRLRGGKKLSAIPAPLRPRARRRLPHPALAATVGGPLPVEPSPNEDQQLRTTEPRLESLTPLHPIISMEIHAGQIGTMNIADDRSLVTRVYSMLVNQQKR